jgi:hypothetical protein
MPSNYASIGKQLYGTSKFIDYPVKLLKDKYLANGLQYVVNYPVLSY